MISEGGAPELSKVIAPVPPVALRCPAAGGAGYPFVSMQSVIAFVISAPETLHPLGVVIPGVALPPLPSTMKRTQTPRSKSTLKTAKRETFVNIGAAEYFTCAAVHVSELDDAPRPRQELPIEQRAESVFAVLVADELLVAVGVAGVGLFVGRHAAD